VSKARLIITAVVLEHRSQAEVARSYNVSKGWVSKLIARWRVDGDAAFQPRSRRPRTSPNAIPASTVELIVNLRTNLQQQGLDHGPATIAWHLRLPAPEQQKTPEHVSSRVSYVPREDMVGVTGFEIESRHGR
jgi:hypothetical protein